MQLMRRRCQVPVPPGGNKIFDLSQGESVHQPVLCLEPLKSRRYDALSHESTALRMSGGS
jgi:hypothetical protein